MVLTIPYCFSIGEGGGAPNTVEKEKERYPTSVVFVFALLLGAYTSNFTPTSDDESGDLGCPWEIDGHSLVRQKSEVDSQDDALLREAGTSKRASARACVRA